MAQDETPSEGSENTGKQDSVSTGVKPWHIAVFLIGLAVIYLIWAMPASETPLETTTTASEPRVEPTSTTYGMMEATTTTFFGFDPMKYCELDSDCVLAKGDCNGCTAGGTNTAIAREYLDEYKRRLEEECRGVVCMPATSNHISCFSRAVCRDNTCVLEPIGDTVSNTTTLRLPTTTTLRVTGYFDRYADEGYHLAYINISFFGRSCANNVGQLLSNEPGIITKSFSLSQDTHWVIYDPEVVSLERVLELAGSSGGSTLVNDTEL